MQKYKITYKYVKKIFENLIILELLIEKEFVQTK